MTLGRVMLGIAAIGFCLGVTREAALFVAGGREPSILGWVGVSLYVGLFLFGIAYLILFAIPRALLRLLLWLMPCFRAEDEDPL